MQFLSSVLNFLDLQPVNSRLVFSIEVDGAMFGLKRRQEVMTSKLSLKHQKVMSQCHTTVLFAVPLK